MPDEPNHVTWKGQPVHRIPAEPGPPKMVPYFTVAAERAPKPRPSIWERLGLRRKKKMRVEDGRLVRWKAPVKP